MPTTTNQKTGEGALLARVERVGLLLAGVATLLSLVAKSIPITAGVVVGAVVGLVNFRVIRLIVSRGLKGRATEQGTPRWAFLGLFFVKFAALIAVVYVLVSATEIDPIGLAGGLTTVFAATVVVTFANVFKARE